MDSAKKMRLKEILHGIAKEAMYDQYAYLKQKYEICDKNQLRSLLLEASSNKENRERSWEPLLA